MTADVVTLTRVNPFLELKDPQTHRWSARDVLGTGLLHKGAQAWNNWNTRILAAKTETELLFGVSAGQSNFATTSKVIQRAKADGSSTGAVIVPDWDLSAFALMYSCLKSDIPETNTWFVLVGLEKMFDQRQRGSMTDEARARAKQTKRVTAMRKAVAGEGPVDGEVQRQLLSMLQVPAEADQLHPVLVALVRTQVHHELTDALEGPYAADVHALKDAFYTAAGNLADMIAAANGITGHKPLPILPISGRGDNFEDPDPKDKGYGVPKF